MRLILAININTQTMLTQNPYFYRSGTTSAGIDAELARQRLDALNKQHGPRVGDFVWFPNEPRPRRFTYDWKDGLWEPIRGDLTSATAESRKRLGKKF